MKKYVFIIACIMGCLTAGARVMTDFFVSMPDSLIPMLSQNARKDLIDFYQSGMKPILPNEWSANSQLTKVKPDLIELNEDSQGTVTTTMAMFNTKGRDTLICLIRTIQTPRPDSEIFFYSTDWRLLKTQRFISLPSAQETSVTAEGSVVDYTQIAISQQDNGITALRVTIDATDGIVDSQSDDIAKRKKTFLYQWNRSKFIKNP